ncbi:MAG: transcription antitermination factor NusB [Bryobacteraceae bacterium]
MGAPGVAVARAVAFDVLAGVDRGAFASDLLRLRAAALDARDAALAQEIVFGVLRFELQLDWLIEHFSGRRGRFDPEVAIALRMGVYQIRYLERIPPHAAVSDSVELVKRARKRSAATLVNAVLRKAHRNPVEWPSRAVELSHPEWMLERWERRFGVEAARAIAEANLEPPSAYFLGERQMDIGSQSIVPLLDLRPGHRLLDLCAAPGNKTAQALESGARVVACDSSFPRLDPLGALGVDRVQLDARHPLPFRRVFDRVLVDAPCSGTGTLARNPEIKRRLRPEDFAMFAARQSAILARALDAVASGGLLVYSTCSLEAEENEAVVDGLTGDTRYRLPGRDPGDGFFAAVIRPGG